MEMWIEVLAAVGVSGLVAALVSWYNSEKTGRLANITSERTKWREDIRRIADALQVAPFGPEAERYLEQLALRVNTYGYADHANVGEDGHIWRLISGMEGSLEKFDEAEYTKQKKTLNRCLSALLKHDWERTKTEVQGDGLLRWIWMAFLLFAVVDMVLSAALAPEGQRGNMVFLSGMYYVLFGAWVLVGTRFRLPVWKKQRGTFEKIGDGAFFIVALLLFLGICWAIFWGVASTYWEYFTVRSNLDVNLYIKGIVLAVVVVLCTVRILNLAKSGEARYETLLEHILPPDPARAQKPAGKSAKTAHSTSKKVRGK